MRPRRRQPRLTTLLLLLARRARFRSIRQENGDAIIEMAIVLPAFTLLLFGIFQFSTAVSGYLSAEYAVNLTTRYAAIHSNTSLVPCSVTDIQNMVKANLFFANAVPANVSVAYYQFAPSSGNVIGNVVSISLVYSQTVSVPFYNHTFSIGSGDYRVVTR